MANGVFTPGTGTLKSATLPRAVCELALLIQTEERVAVTNQEAVIAAGLEVPNNFNIQVNLDNDTITITATAIPIQLSLVSGNITIQAVDYLAPLDAVVPSIESGITVTDSDLSKTTKLGAFLELVQLIQIDEQALAENPQRVTMNFDADALIANITATFNVAPSIDSTNGAIEILAQNYLTV